MEIGGDTSFIVVVDNLGRGRIPSNPPLIARYCCHFWEISFCSNASPPPYVGCWARQKSSQTYDEAAFPLIFLPAGFLNSRIRADNFLAKNSPNRKSLEIQRRRRHPLLFLRGKQHCLRMRCLSPRVRRRKISLGYRMTGRRESVPEPFSPLGYREWRGVGGAFVISFLRPLLLCSTV